MSGTAALPSRPLYTNEPTFFRHRPTSDQPRWKLRLYAVVFESDTQRCKFCYTPKSRTEFWLPKFERNIALVTRTLRKAGWNVVRIWECQLATKNQARVIVRIRKALKEK